MVYSILAHDDAAQSVYHATCAVELATDILVDLFTFLSSPPPYERFFVLTPPDTTSPEPPSVEGG